MTMQKCVMSAVVLALVLGVAGGCKRTTAVEDDQTTVAVAIIDSQPLDSAYVVNDAIDVEHAEKARKLMDAAMRYLLSQRDTDGGWSMDYDGQRAFQPALTALVVKSVLADPRFNIHSPVVAEAYAVLLSHQQPDGGIYEPHAGKSNYCTSLAVMALVPAVAADEAAYMSHLESAVAYLRSCQIEVGDITPAGVMIGEDSSFVGGVNYGDHGRPDLSNVGMWMQAMHESGVSGEDPAVQKALAFVTRTQNASESNTLSWAVEGPNDGGFIYAPETAEGDGESKALMDPAGGFRSYGSMTYTGFMSMLYADVPKTDPRVRGAYSWICRYWTLDSNPNMPHAQTLEGIYYYYYVFAKALRANGEAEIVDFDGVRHNWREELIDALADRMRDDGSWIGVERWGETDPILVTGYVLNALQQATAP